MKKNRTIRAALPSWLLVMGCVLLVWGCGSKQQQPSVSYSRPSVSSQDVSAPLTPAELAVLNRSRGRVDKDVPSEAMDDVAEQYKYFLRHGRKTMCVISRRAEPYLSYVQQVFRSRGMPEELAYLALVESGYKADARSPAGAAGTWQFMPRTGRYFGLTQDDWLDERLDSYRATEAAADYLQKLYEYFGDWPTAIAAYNAGEGKIKKAMEGTGGRDFFEVKERNHRLHYAERLKDETKQYVPRFLAMSKIMRNLPQLGFEPINPQSAMPVSRLSARPGTDLRAVSSACRLDWNSFKEYNQHHKRTITSTQQTTNVYVPQAYVQAAQAFLNGPASNPYAGWQVARVSSSSDSWEKISRRSNVPVSLLRAANPDLSRLRAGSRVLVPPTARMRQVAEAESRPSTGSRKVDRGRTAPREYAQSSRRSDDAPRIHCLQPNETLYAVARRYEVSLQALQQHNSIKDPHKVRAGDTLRIPSSAHKGGSTGKVGQRKRQYYTVQANDSLWNIARKYKVSVDDLKRWNNISPKELRPGVRLMVELQ